MRSVVGQHSLDDVLAKTEVINASIRQILDTTTVEWGVEVTLVELKDIQLPDSMKRAMAREAEAEREKRAKIIAAEGEARGPRPSRCRLAHPGPADMVGVTVDSGDTGYARQPAGSARDCFSRRHRTGDVFDRPGCALGFARGIAATA